MLVLGDQGLKPGNGSFPFLQVPAPNPSTAHRTAPSSTDAGGRTISQSHAMPHWGSMTRTGGVTALTSEAPVPMATGW